MELSSRPNNNSFTKGHAKNFNYCICGLGIGINL